MSGCSRSRFQSHAGSIEAAGVPAGFSQSNPRFNPTLVRLRPPFGLAGGGPGGFGFNPTLVRLRRWSTTRMLRTLPSFNPTLVRLRRGGLLVSEQHLRGFQSHAGSIEARGTLEGLQPASQGFNPTLVRLRRTRSSSRNTLRHGFNPTLVRLRQMEPRAEADRVLRFNPTLVRLRPAASAAFCSSPWGFNPTLVRLRRDASDLLYFVASPFQSHAGSIEATLRGPGVSGLFPFQSHAGSIEAKSGTGWIINH